MASFWEEIRNKVREHTTSADVASRIHQKLASTGVQTPAVTKPAFYLGQLSVLTMDFMDYTERLIELEDRDYAGYLTAVNFLRECGRSISHNISRAAEPLERLIVMTEEILESEEFATLEDEEEDLEGELLDEEAEADAEAEDEADDDLDEDEEGIEREEMSGDREALEEGLRVKLRNDGFSDSVTEALASQISGIYLECVQLARELARLAKAPDEDTSTIMSILIDLQYGLDSQLRGFLVEDVNTSELEPTFSLGFPTWSAHLVAETMELMAEKPALVTAGEA